MRRPGLLITTMTGVLLLLAGSGCGSGSDGAVPSPTPSPATSSPAGDGISDGTSDGVGPGAPPPVPTTTAPSAPSGSGDGGGDGSGKGGVSEWTSGSLTVTHDPAVPPVPRLLRIRSAAHSDEGYDRIVFDFTGPLPGYTVRYVDQVRQDPSDNPVTVPGRRFLLIVFTPAQAHTDAGAALVSPQRKDLAYPMMRGYALVGDFEGYVSVAIGLDDVVGYRVGELPGIPGRIYLDVAA